MLSTARCTYHGNCLLKGLTSVKLSLLLKGFAKVGIYEYIKGIKGTHIPSKKRQWPRRMEEEQKSPQQIPVMVQIIVA